MRLLFWFSLAVIAYTYFGYPFYIWAKSVVTPRPWKKAEIYPTVTVIMAVHNGAALIRQKIEHLLSLDYPADKYHVVVVSDGSTDGTSEMLRGLSHPKLRAIVLPQNQGKAMALNAGIAAADGDVLLFVDIRPRIAPGAVAALVSNFADPQVGCVAGELILRNDDHDAATSAVGGLYWRYEQWMRDCEARFDSPLGVYGGFYAIRRELAVEFPAGTILDDMYQPLAIIRRGYRSVLEKSAVVYDTWPKTMEGEFRRKVRTLAGNFQLLEVQPWLLTPAYRLFAQFWSHKLLRLLVPYLLMAMFTASVALAWQSPAFALIAVLQVAFFAIAGAACYVPLGKLAGAASAFCSLNFAAVIAAWRYITRDLERVWVTAPMNKASAAQLDYSTPDELPTTTTDEVAVQTGAQ